MFWTNPSKLRLPSTSEALPGRTQPLDVPPQHFVNGQSLVGPYPDGSQVAVFAMGCFWGAEKLLWETPGVYVTAVGYSGGQTPNPTYEEACSGRTGHAEAVQVVFDPMRVSYEELLRLFWEKHDPTQGMRQGNDVGTQYRSAIYWHDEDQKRTAEASREAYQRELNQAGFGEISTEIAKAGPFFFAEGYHQQYLARNPHGYDCANGTGVACPVGLVTT